jgi:hypothetical protein
MSENALRNTPAPPAPLTPADITRYLNYACEDLKARRDELVKALVKTAKSYPHIADGRDDIVGLCAENMRMASALSRTAEDERTTNKAPFLTGGRAVDTWFKAWAASLLSAMEPVQAAMDDFGARKLAREQAEALAAKALADAEADRAADAAAEALRAGRPDEASAALDRVTGAAQAAEKAEERANAKPADLTRSYGAYGAVASVRQTWGWEVTDINAVPRAHLMLNPDSIKAAAKQRDAAGRPIADIPGIRWVPTTKMGVR